MQVVHSSFLYFRFHYKEEIIERLLHEIFGIKKSTVDKHVNVKVLLFNQCLQWLYVLRKFKLNLRKSFTDVHRHDLHICKVVCFAA
jgi:hypothetical protein